MHKLKKTKTIKKELPARFQEVLAESEIQLSEKLSVDVLKKLVYLYSLAMQHYSLDNKNKLQDFYSQKLNTLLTREDVGEFLDKNKVNINDTSDLNLFPEEEVNKNSNKSNSNKTYNKFTGLIKKKFKIAPDFDKEKALKEIREKIKNVDIYIEKITKEITQDTMEQSAQFNARRRKESFKKAKEEPEEPPKRSAESIGSESDSENEEDKAFFEEIQKSAELEKQEEKKVEGISQLKLDNINTNSEQNIVNNPPSSSSKKSSGRRGSLGNPKYFEIEAMKKRLLEKENDEILILQKESEDQMKEFENNPDFLEICKEDLQDKIDNLHMEILDQMAKETEKIEKKYEKMKNNIFALYQNQ